MQDEQRDVHTQTVYIYKHVDLLHFSASTPLTPTQLHHFSHFPLSLSLSLSKEVLNPVIPTQGSALLSCVPRQRASPPFCIVLLFMHGEGLAAVGQSVLDISSSSSIRTDGGGLIHILFQQHLSKPKSSNIFQANAERERRGVKRKAKRERQETRGRCVCVCVWESMILHALVHMPECVCTYIYSIYIMCWRLRTDGDEKCARVQESKRWIKRRDKGGDSMHKTGYKTFSMISDFKYVNDWYELHGVTLSHNVNMLFSFWNSNQKGSQQKVWRLKRDRSTGGAAAQPVIRTIT